jgi:tetratricopeptide (TPR) repeat protein
MSVILLGVPGCRTFGRGGPTDAKVVAARELCRSGQDAWECSRWDEARWKFSRALELYPQHVESRRNLAHASWQRGEREEALAQMRRVVEQTGGEPAAATELGQMLLEDNQLDEALACAELALSGDSRLTSALVLRADILRRRGQASEALDNYHLARSYGCHDSRILLEMAELQLHFQRPERALATLTTAGQLPDATQQLQLRRLLLTASAYRQVQRHADALEQLALANTLSPNTPHVMGQLGETQLAAGQFVEAEQTLAQLTNIAPHVPATIELSEQLRLAAQPQIAHASELR